MLDNIRSKATVGILSKLKKKGTPPAESMMGPYTPETEVEEVSPSGDVTVASDSELLRELERRQAGRKASVGP
jgi:hypothetical protein